MPYLINKRIDLTRTSRCRLSIQAHLNGFSFAILDEAEATTLCRQLHGHTFPDSHNPDDIYSETIMWCQKYSQLKYHYASTQCVFCTPTFTLVPESLFDPDRAAAILQSVHNINDLDEIYFHPLPQLEAICVYAIPNSITAPILKHQPTTRFYSIAVPLIQMLMPLYGHTRILFYVHNDYLYLTLAKEQQLLLCNAYHTPEFTTALYFLSLVLHQWQLNPDSTSLYISGQIPKHHRKMLHNYFPFITALSHNSIALPTLEHTLEYGTILHTVCAS